MKRKDYFFYVIETKNLTIPVYDAKRYPPDQRNDSNSSNSTNSTD